LQQCRTGVVAAAVLPKRSLIGACAVGMVVLSTRLTRRIPLRYPGVLSLRYTTLARLDSSSPHRFQSAASSRRSNAPCPAHTDPYGSGPRLAAPAHASDATSTRQDATLYRLQLSHESQRRHQPGVAKNQTSLTCSGWPYGKWVHLLWVALW
jgi:hypothetical protein